MSAVNFLEKKQYFIEGHHKSSPDGVLFGLHLIMGIYKYQADI